ncbi:Putative ribonuclease H protein [Arachis hypogaea]|nr:Putative ribonuclease H protein [Arachis hypogaea]
MAGRVVLAQSTISPVAYFSMQHNRIPISICNEIEKAQRDFIWGSDDSNKKAHLIGRQTLCFPKSMGGLGMKNLNIMNRAFLDKIYWELIEKLNDLWASIIWAKYNPNKNPHLISRAANCSSLWKNLAPMWSFIRENTIHIIGNCLNTLFWRDVWLDMDRPLMELVLPNKNVGNTEAKAWEFTNDHGDWNIGKLKCLLPNDCIFHIESAPPPRSSDPPDTLA